MNVKINKQQTTLFPTIQQFLMKQKSKTFSFLEQTLMYLIF